MEPNRSVTRPGISNRLAYAILTRLSGLVLLNRAVRKDQLLHRSKNRSLRTHLKTHEKSAGTQMFGTLVVGSAALFLASTAALEMVDALVDRRRQNSAKPQNLAVPARVSVQTPVAAAWEAPEKLLKAA